MKEIIEKLQKNEDLSAAEMRAVMEKIMTGQANDAAIERFLLLLRQKGETVNEILSAVEVMREHALKLQKKFPDLLDTCGTGGDEKQTLNVSTLAAIVASSAGATIGKHGNRSVSSLCGSADLLEMFGVEVAQEPADVERSIERLGFGFFFAPVFHPAVRHAMPARKRIQGKTIFNLLGPLSNPGSAGYQLLGVYDEKWVSVLAEVLFGLGTKKALVVHGMEGMDEISLTRETRVAEITSSKISFFTIKPEDFNLRPVSSEDLRCPSKDACRSAALEVLGGTRGPYQDIVSLNAGAALYVSGNAGTIKDGVELARQALISGASSKKLDAIADFSKKKAEK